MPSKITKLAYLLVAAVASVTAVPTKAAMLKSLHAPRASTLHFAPSDTFSESPTTCVNGVPASSQRPDGYPINDYTYVTPTANWTSYKVKPDWYNLHYVSGPHVQASTHRSDPYGAFECQFTCNAAGDCNAFFVEYVNIGEESEHLNCVLFNATINNSDFVQTTGNIGAGGYSRLCHPKV
ncbi:hypothetical protein B0T22DRAFT_230957 [Podospora appendiculata]|uniref:Apple domain-containing protein n=1 Tax=Podospora appendiculata TaxID=314037 RepID=A0AAE0X6D9_9PEZI|nr:hypothetical protein B0T22DRAFT_230957 [Podospora appendiculata]